MYEGHVCTSRAFGSVRPGLVPRIDALRKQVWYATWGWTGSTTTRARTELMCSLLAGRPPSIQHHPFVCDRYSMCDQKNLDLRLCLTFVCGAVNNINIPVLVPSPPASVLRRPLLLLSAPKPATFRARHNNKKNLRPKRMSPLGWG